MPASGIDESEAIVATTCEGRIAWSEASPTDAGEPTLPLVLIHGFTGHRDDFIGLLPELSERRRKRRVIAPDLRGHGDSDPGPGVSGWSFEQLVRDLLGFLDPLGLERVDLLGHSMGGFVVLRFALAYPERVRSLTFLCTGPEKPASLPRAGFLKASEIAEARGLDGLQKIIEKAGRIDPSPSIDRWGDRYWMHHRRRFRAMTPASYRGIGAAFFDSESLVQRLKEVECPSLVLVGEFDRDWLPGADLFEQTLPVVRRSTLLNAEHHPHVENTEAFLEAMEAHLDAVEEAERLGPKGTVRTKTNYERTMT